MDLATTSGSYPATSTTVSQRRPRSAVRSELRSPRRWCASGNKEGLVNPRLKSVTSTPCASARSIKDAADETCPAQDEHAVGCGVAERFVLGPSRRWSAMDQEQACENLSGGADRSRSRSTANEGRSREVMPGRQQATRNTPGQERAAVPSDCTASPLPVTSNTVARRDDRITTSTLRTSRSPLRSPEQTRVDADQARN